MSDRRTSISEDSDVDLSVSWPLGAVALDDHEIEDTRDHNIDVRGSTLTKWSHTQEEISLKAWGVCRGD